uniref:Uncharacterized protein n=1 Tax=Anguilla anguilla TaxID=7936 RepID=A0A0E9Q6C9_ANGAN
MRVLASNHISVILFSGLAALVCCCATKSLPGCI